MKFTINLKYSKIKIFLSIFFIFLSISKTNSTKIKSSITEKASKSNRIKSISENTKSLSENTHKTKFLRNMRRKYTIKNKLHSAHQEDLSSEYKGFSDLLIFNCTKKNYFALTWDDGPQEKLTNGILDVLKLKNVKATFFIVARRLLWEPHNQAARRAFNEGHQIASHSWNHENLTDKVSKNRNCTELRRQVFESDKIFREKLGVSPKFFRPPYGEITKEVAQTLRLWDYYIPIWNLNTFDWFWKGIQKLKIVKSYTDELKNEDKSLPRQDSYVSLQHDISRNVEATIERYSYLIDLIREKGYKLVTMAECVGKEDDEYFKKVIDYKQQQCSFKSDD